MLYVKAGPRRVLRKLLLTPGRLLSYLCTVLSLVAVLSLCSCQTTSRYRSFSKIKEGMTKTSVVETVGGPDHAVRVDGKVRWIYVFYNDGENPEEREVQFVDAKVSYVGPRTKPETSAEEQDRKNEAANEADASETKAHSAKHSKRLGRMHLDHSLRDPDLEDSLYGDQNDSGRHKIAPTFIPVE